MDCEWVHRAINKGLKFVTTDEPLAVMNTCGRSQQDFARSLNEFRISAISNGANWFVASFYFIQQLVFKSLMKVALIKKMKLRAR